MSALFTQPKNTMPKIESIWAYVSVDADDGNEGVCAVTFGNGITIPLIAADPARLDSIRPLAMDLAAKTGMKIRLVRFTSREEIEEIVNK